jgi:hypothetical protein
MEIHVTQGDDGHVHIRTSDGLVIAEAAREQLEREVERLLTEHQQP